MLVKLDWMGCRIEKAWRCRVYHQPKWEKQAKKAAGAVGFYIIEASKPSSSTGGYDGGYSLCVTTLTVECRTATREICCGEADW